MTQIIKLRYLPLPFYLQQVATLRNCGVDNSITLMYVYLIGRLFPSIGRKDM